MVRMTKTTMSYTTSQTNTKKPSDTKIAILRTCHKVRDFYTIRALKLNDLVIFFVVTFGVFLPVRWFFYGYVTHHVLPNLGMVTLIAVVVFLLVRSGKLGFVGRAFKRQMIRFVASRTFRRIF